MSTAIRVSVRGVKSLERTAVLIQELGKLDRKRLLDELGAVGVSQTQERISSGGPGPDGGPWAPLSESYAASKKKRSSGGILQFSGHLLMSMTHNVVGAGDVEWGSNLEYAAVHQFGDDSTVSVSSHVRIISEAFGKTLPFPVASTVAGFERKQNTPARPFLGVSERDGGEIEQTAAAFVERTLPKRVS
jgi:phage gpG-like protein